MRRRPALLIGLALSTAVSIVGADDAAMSCAVDRPTTFGRWREWTPVTPDPVVSPGHSANWVGISVDERAEATYLAAGSPYPECAMIVKPVYTDETGQHVRKLTVMVKMPAGYDTANGDWWYASYDASGTRMGENGKLPTCIVCHKRAAEIDYLFSKNVLEAAKE